MRDGHWTAQILGAAASPSRVMGNGREDGTIREDLAATNGEKPLKGGYPWTIRHETRLGDPRHEKSQERQTWPVGVRLQGRTIGRVNVDLKAS